MRKQLKPTLEAFPVTIDSDILKNEEKISFALRSLYHRKGYAPYRMGKFEDYALYVKNKDFLPTSELISFTDTNGRLKALKPDVTLSIVRSARPEAGQVQKLYYYENVYRVSESSRCFKEIRQAGLECIGEMNEDLIAEVLGLAQESLRLISDGSVLSVSHLGIVGGMLDALQLEADARRQALGFISGKSLHELASLLRRSGAEKEAAERLLALTACSGAPAEVLETLRTLACPQAALSELERLTAKLDETSLRLDFSILGDMRYYNGIAFQGYVPGVPSGVLSGGQYDRLLHRMGKKGGAIGFACYLDKLERLEVKGHA